MKWHQLVVSGLFLLMSLGNAKAQGNYILNDHQVSINGTSNLHDWKETVGKVNGTGEVIIAGQNTFSLRSFKIVIQVASIKSTEGSIMDNKTHSALKSDKFPEISFLLTEPVNMLPAPPNGYDLTANGSLTIAGVTRPVSISVKVDEQADKNIIIEGQQQFKMTDYGVKPPVALMGVLKTGDLIIIKFKVTFSPLITANSHETH